MIVINSCFISSIVAGCFALLAISFGVFLIGNLLRRNFRFPPSNFALSPTPHNDSNFVQIATVHRVNYFEPQSYYLFILYVSS